MLLRLEMSFDLFAYISRLDDGINLSTEIAELVSYRPRRLSIRRYSARFRRIIVNYLQLSKIIYKL